MQPQVKMKQGRILGIVGTIVKGGDGKPDRVIEKHIIKPDGIKELTFMAEERKEYLKGKGTLKDYLKQFDKISGVQQ